MVKLKHYKNFDQRSWTPMPDGWTCGNIGKNVLVIGCSQPFGSMMYLVGVEGGVGGEWICADCCRELGFIW